MPAQYEGLGNAIRKGVKGALEKGIEILGLVPSANKDKGKSVNIVDIASGKIEGTAIELNGKLYKPNSTTEFTAAELEGKATSEAFNFPRAPLVSTARNPEEERAAKSKEVNLNDQRLMYEEVVPQQETARNLLENSRRIYSSIENGSKSGAVVEGALDVAKRIQGLYTIAGKTAPVAVLNAVGDASALTKIGYEAMLPLIEAQGRGFTDKDREAAKLVLPGLSQPWQYNEMVADMDTLKGLKLQEQMVFATGRKNLNEVVGDSELLWTNYLNDLPMSEVKEVTKDGLMYKRVRPIRDNENLSQYWVKARPKGFKIRNNSEIVTMTMKDVRDTAADAKTGGGISPREFLARLSNQGLIIEGVY